jgi:hypothetical protein
MRQIDAEQLGCALDQQRHGPRTLRLLARAAALVFGDVGADYDCQLVRTVALGIA